MKHLVLPALAATLGLGAGAAPAQEHQHTPGMQHPPAVGAPAALPLEGGQAEFAAVGEIANLLQADPATDWSKVDLGALRAHLLDMDNVIMRAQVVTTPIAGGARFEVSGATPEVRQSIQRMVVSHAAMTDGDFGRHEVSMTTPNGATLIVTGQDESAATRIRALGFFGILTGGMHHQRHHLMMARGGMTH